MILIGYAVCVLYVFFLIILTKLVFKLTAVTEISRKSLHIGTFGILFIAKIFFTDFFHYAVICGIFAVFTFFVVKFKLFKDIERETPSFGVFYYSLSLFACAVCICFLPDLYPCFVAAFTALAVGDGAASVFGRITENIKISKSKTLSGTVACIFFTFLILFVLTSTDFISVELTTVIAVSVASGIFELTETGFDNLTVPFSVFILCSSCFYFGTPFTVSLLVAEAVFLAAFLSKFITYRGSLLAGGIGFSFYYFGGLFAFIYILGCYSIMLLTHIVRKIVKSRSNGEKFSVHGKNAIQIFVNGFIGTASVVFYGIFKLELFLVAALITVGSAFVDSVSSDIGTLSKGKTYDIITRKPIEKGLSGGVSLLGTVTAFFTCIVLSVATVLITSLPIYYAAILTAVIFTGTVTDSLLGSLIQAKYKCTVCGKITENRVCCQTETVLERGLRFIDNNAVNFISPIVPFAVCCFVMSLCLV